MDKLDALRSALTAGAPALPAVSDLLQATQATLVLPTDGHGRTALILACEHGRGLELLRQRFPASKESAGSGPEIANDDNLDIRANFAAADLFGRSAMHWACRRREISVAEFALDSCRSIEDSRSLAHNKINTSLISFASQTGENCLHWLALGSAEDDAKSAEMANLLVSHQAANLGAREASLAVSNAGKRPVDLCDAEKAPLTYAVLKSALEKAQASVAVAESIVDTSEQTSSGKEIESGVADADVSKGVGVSLTPAVAVPKRTGPRKQRIAIRKK